VSTETADKPHLCQANELSRMANEVLRHCTVFPFIARSRQKIYGIHFLRISVSQARSKGREPAIKTLGATPAVGLQFGHAINMTAADSLGQKIDLTGLANYSGHLRLGFPDIWILNFDLFIQQG
jgi:hypothetical protein